jgi:hypothetical protein
MITYVTAFLLRPESKHPVEEYKAHFERLAATGISIVLFLDRQVSWTFPENVHVLPVSLEETWVAQNVPECVELPSIRSASDTREYLMIQNSKTEFVWRASELNPWKTEWFAWIDFGICHVFREPERTLERIRILVPPECPCIRTAGIWEGSYPDFFNQVCWRYAGGFFLIHQSRIEKFHEAVQTSILRILPQFAWEVNVWADVERRGVELGWYRADHNDTIIPCIETLQTTVGTEEQTA